jgi:hypothetical protein
MWLSVARAQKRVRGREDRWQGHTRRRQANEEENQPQGPAHGGESQGGTTGRANREATHQTVQGTAEGMCLFVVASCDVPLACLHVFFSSRTDQTKLLE